MRVVSLSSLRLARTGTVKDSPEKARALHTRQQRHSCMMIHEDGRRLPRGLEEFGRSSQGPSSPGALPYLTTQDEIHRIEACPNHAQGNFGVARLNVLILF